MFRPHEYSGKSERLLYHNSSSTTQTVVYGTNHDVRKAVCANRHTINFDVRRARAVKGRAGDSIAVGRIDLRQPEKVVSTHRQRKG